MINVGICDDQVALAEVVQMVAADYFDTCNIDCNIIKTHDVAGFLAHKDKYDIVLIDVRLRDKMTGIEAAGVMRETNKTVQIIFMSGIQEDMKDVPHIGFLLKPFDICDLQKLLGKAMDNLK